MFDEIIDISKVPTIDLHGETAMIASVMINDFINENLKQKKYIIAIIHGKGSGILKHTTSETLRNNKNVLEYKICYFNDGMTLVKLRR